MTVCRARNSAQVEEMADLEAAELGYSLLTGMDACHQRQVDFF